MKLCLCPSPLSVSCSPPPRFLSLISSPYLLHYRPLGSSTPPKGLTSLTQTHYCAWSSRSHELSPVHSKNLVVSYASNMAAGHSDGPRKLDLHRFFELIQHFAENMPQPVKKFPWIKALENFVQIIFELIYAVAKCLVVPLLAVSSLSEMSYCAQERKMIFIPIPLLAGFAVASILEDTAVELSPDLQKEEFPWHLLSMAIFFTFLKLPGPYYPYWARIFVPHFANGGLWRTLWFAYLWYKKPKETSTETHVDETYSENKP